jgi:CheY-like chemotaxis protein
MKMEKRGTKKILVVDDEKDTVEMITALLELEGYQILLRSQGLRRWESSRPRAKGFRILKRLLI